MTMAAATLGTALQGIGGSTDSGACDDWATAWATYFADAVSSTGDTFTTNTTYIAAAKSAMAAAMSGLSAAGAGAAKVQAGVIAWWDYLVANPTGSFTGSPASVTKPTTLTSIAAALPSVFASNQSGSVSAAVGCLAVATSIHGNNAGGKVAGKTIT
jgi:hypothetical protein